MGKEVELCKSKLMPGTVWVRKSAVCAAGDVPVRRKQPLRRQGSVF